MDALLRRRMMIGAGGEPGPSIPIYELASPTTEQGYNTGVKLFDTAKSFTILCEITYNNYSWTFPCGLFGILSGTNNYNFKLGSIEGCKNYQNGTLQGTSTLQEALILNKTASNRRGTYIFAKTNGERTHKIFVRYDSTTRLVECGIEALPTAHYYTTDGALTSSEELKLLIGGATGTVNIFKVYFSALPDAEINAFYE